MSPQSTLHADGFDRLLAALDSDRERAGQRYQELRERLIRVLLWERATDPETLADEVLTRLARRLAEGEVVQNIPAFLNGIARNVLKEEATRLHRLAPLTDVPAPASDAEVEQLHVALERCLSSWEPDKRQFLLAYYQGDQTARIRNRARLAAELGLELNALRNRALRLRDRLENCLRQRDVSAAIPTTDRKGRT